MKFNQATTKSRTFLATTALESFWDKSQPILFLGDWCTTYNNKKSWENLDAELLSSPLLHHQPDEVLKYVEKIQSILLPKIAHWLNQIHHTHHSITYWEIVVGSFLFIHIQTVYDRYWRLKKAYQLYPDLQTIGLAETSFITPLNLQEYYTFTMQSDVWNLQCCTQIIKLITNSIITYQDHNTTVETAQHKSFLAGKYKLKTYIKIYLLWFLVKWRGKKTVALVQQEFNKKNLLNLILLSKFTILPILPRRKTEKESNNLSATQINFDLRATLNNINIEDDFAKLVLQLLVNNMPMSFIENYQAVCGISKKEYPYFVKMIVGSPIASNESLKIWQAKNVGNGMKRIGLQHGGGYGALRSVSDEYLEHKCADFYITWGVKQDGKIVGAPAIPLCEQLSAPKKKSLQKNSKILWVATEFTRYPIPEIKLALGMNHYAELYYQWQEKILNLLSANIVNTLTMRLRHSDFTDRWKFLRDQFPHLNLYKPQERTSFTQQLNEAKLLLFDNLNTTHLYGLVMNIPSILFWDEKIWTIRNEVKHYFDALQAVGIFHTSPESAADMINKISHDPSSWWQNRDVQLARQQYCDYFADVKTGWLKKWNSILLTLMQKSN